MRLPEDGAVIDYRAYLTDIEGHIVDVELIQAFDDAAAWRAALALKGGAGLEVWCRDREVPFSVARVARPEVLAARSPGPAVKLCTGANEVRWRHVSGKP